MVNFFLLPTVGVIPGEPTDVVVTEATKSYVVLAWKPPVQRGHEGVMYYIEKVVIIVFFFCTSFLFTMVRLRASSPNRAAVDVSAFQGRTAGRG